MQHNSSDNTAKARWEKGACENERAGGKRKVVYFKSALVPTESGIKIEPSLVKL